MTACSISRSIFGYIRAGTEWSQVFETQAVGWNSGDQFGHAMAFDGTRIIVGAIGDKTKGGFAGAAYVFRVDGETCVQESKLLASDGSAGDEFGKSVAIDGNRAIVGAWDDDPVGVWNSGSAYIFERSETDQWTEVAKVFPSVVGTLDRFGTSVAVRGDEAFVGAIGSGSIDFGAVYVFQRQRNGTWLETQKLVHENAQNSDRLGRSVAVEGSVLVAGAFQADAPIGTTGMLEVFERSLLGYWKQCGTAYADRGTGELGTNVALAGGLALCGLLEDAPNGIESGSAYVLAVGPDANSNGLMDPCECPGDLNKDWIVDQDDLGLLLANWGCTGGLGYDPSNKACPGAQTGCCGDLDADGDVDQADLGVMLRNFGNICP